MFKFDGENLLVYKMRYAKPMNTCIQLVCEEDGCPYATLSVNVSDELESDEIVLKNYNENAFVANCAVGRGLLSYTDKWIQVGYTRCPICKINPDMVDMDFTE